MEAADREGVARPVAASIDVLFFLHALACWVSGLGGCTHLRRKCCRFTLTLLHFGHPLSLSLRHTGQWKASSMLSCGWRHVTNLACESFPGVRTRWEIGSTPCLDQVVTRPMVAKSFGPRIPQAVSTPQSGTGGEQICTRHAFV